MTHQYRGYDYDVNVCDANGDVDVCHVSWDDDQGRRVGVDVPFGGGLFLAADIILKSCLWLQDCEI